jgi:hypothetical protein
MIVIQARHVHLQDIVAAAQQAARTGVWDDVLRFHQDHLEDLLRLSVYHDQFDTKAAAAVLQSGSEVSARMLIQVCIVLASSK